ncbi:MAG: hypothetical protein LKJ76_09375 [Lachnospiraceae bacterium]|jgi:type II secretory pathway pseudopilin PulG|nr:hypothetical protein [Lachnospiraceae bacterium]
MGKKPKTKGKAGAQENTHGGLLIAAAVIAVLIALAVPVLMAQLDRARAATDAANVRAAKAAALAAYNGLGSDAGTVVYYYDARSGSVTTDAGEAAEYEGYGKSSKQEEGAEGTPSRGGIANILTVTVSAEGAAARWGLRIRSGADLGACSTWETIAEKAGASGYVRLPAGTLISDGTSTVLCYGDGRRYEVKQGGSLQDFLKNNADSVSDVTSIAVDDWSSSLSYPAGYVVRYSDVYYVAKKKITWVEVPSGNMNWALIGG